MCIFMASFYNDQSMYEFRIDTQNHHIYAFDRHITRINITEAMEDAIWKN